MKLSVIIPVYNVENYIQQCLDSIYIEHLSEIEYIIINDGSTDSSLEIINNRYGHKNNIKIINQKNRGLSVARNVGLKQAQGDYVYFIDSDDFIDPISFQSILKYCDYDYDIIVGDYYDYIDQSHVELSSNRILTKEKICQSGVDFFLKYHKQLSSVVWRGLYKTKFLLSNSLFFHEGVCFEDVEWTPIAYCKALNICYIPSAFYYYRRRQNSITTCSVDLKKVNDACTICKTLLCESKKFERKDICNMLITNGLHCFFYFASRSEKVIPSYIWHDMSLYLSDYIIQSKRYRLLFWLMKKSPVLLVKLLKIVYK